MRGSFWLVCYFPSLGIIIIMVVAVCRKSPVLGRNRRGWQQGAAGPGGLLRWRQRWQRQQRRQRRSPGCCKWRDWKACVSCLSPPPSASSSLLPPPAPQDAGRAGGWSADPQPRGAAGPAPRQSRLGNPLGWRAPRARRPCWAGLARGSAPGPRPPIGSRRRRGACLGGPPGLPLSGGVLVALVIRPLASHCPLSLATVQKAKLPFFCPRRHVPLTHSSGTFWARCCSLLYRE